MTWTFFILCNNINSLTSINHIVRIVSNTCNFFLEFLTTKERETCTYRRGSWKCVSHAYVPVSYSKICTTCCAIMNPFAVNLNHLMCKSRKVTVRTNTKSLMKWLCCNFNSAQCTQTILKLCTPLCWTIK